MSRNLNSFEEKHFVLQGYISLVKQHIKEDYAVIVIDNSDIVKSASQKLETQIRLGIDRTKEMAYY